MRGMLFVAGLTILMTTWRSPVLVVPRWWQLGLVAALLQVPAYIGNTADWLLPVSYALLCTVGWRNRSHAGGRLIFAGTLLNALPILILGHMPLSVDMLNWGGQGAALGAELPMSKDVVVDGSPWLLLGDSIPVAVLGWKAAWSIGDVALCCGALRFATSGRGMRKYSEYQEALP